MTIQRTKALEIISEKSTLKRNLLTFPCTKCSKHKELLSSVNSSATRRTRQPEPNQKADVSNRGLGMLFFCMGNNLITSDKAFRIISTLDLNSIVFPSSQESRSLLCHNPWIWHLSKSCRNEIKGEGHKPWE